jgi:DNA-binding MarR family transcriptional regulator
MYICGMRLEDAIKTVNFKSELHKASLNILYTAWVIKTISNNVLKKYGLTHEQYNVLRILKGKHPEQLCVKEIGSRMIERNSNVPRIIDRLECKKLVKRHMSPTDRRETIISISEIGLLVLAETTKLLETELNQSLFLEKAEACQLNFLLEKIRVK